MKSIILSVAAVVLGAAAVVLSVSGQSRKASPAPTVAQCQSDLKLYVSKLEVAPAQSGTADVPFRNLIAWGDEMQVCQTVDSQHTDTYYAVGAEVHAEQSLRMFHFLNRHNFSLQFLAEDEAGKR
jgi:hypothetical protein